MIYLSTFLVLLVASHFSGSKVMAVCSRENIGTCYRRVSYLVYQTSYSSASTTRSYKCGWWDWKRCSSTSYYRTSSAISVTRYRTETSCCSGYHDVQGICKPMCNPSCEADHTCVAPNTCRKGVQLLLGGVNYPNNSAIQFDNLYYTSDYCHSLLCATDQIPCCSYRDGNWYVVSQNGRYLGAVSTSMEDSYYQTWNSDGTVHLIRRDTTQFTSASLYCCQLDMHTLCVTIVLSSPGVWLLLNGQLYSNNSAIELREIFESADNSHSLMCVTSKRPCCGTRPHRFGEWFYPNGSVVSISGTTNSFYRNRGDDGTVRLHRRGIISSSAASGQYCCEIPNSDDIVQRLCVHFVDSSPGVWLSSSTDGQYYVNDSVITLREVYFNQSQSLKCITERQPCCSGQNPIGNWYYPNGSIVPNIEEGDDFYTERRNDGTVHLYIRNTFVSFTSTMQFCCVLPNINDLTQKLCVHLAPVINVGHEITTTTISNYVDISFIQFRLFGIVNCYEWVHQHALLKEEELVTAITDNVEGECQCGISRSQFSAGAFQCFQDSAKGAVTYRTKLQPISNTTIHYISSWTSSSPVVPIRGVLLQIDGMCSLSVESFSDPECGVVNEQEKITVSLGVTSFTAVQNEIDNLQVLIGGAVGFVVMVLVVVCCLLIIILTGAVILWKKFKARNNIMADTAAPTTSKLAESNIDVTPHTGYDQSEKYRAVYEEVSATGTDKMSACVAYHVIKHHS